ncbi:type I-E CRISPR-associated protein Cse1/CasA [Streptomyces pristinaespiralis]|nr:type I-E CRISPR-associated protein Cse1/CasA [Streptomyces pristinaespiralis]
MSGDGGGVDLRHAGRTPGWRTEPGARRRPAAPVRTAGRRPPALHTGVPETDESSGNGVLPFGLTTQPWIPVLRGDGTQDELSLREVFAQAAGLRRIVGDLPTQEFALVRLMLAVVHDALDGPQDIEDWSDLWADERCFAPVDAYLDAHRGRFDLLDAQAPLPAPAMVQRIWIARFG